jgi:hypothetical protein
MSESEARAEPSWESDWSPAALKRARYVWREQTEDGEAELAICIACGVWDRWDSHVTNYGACFDGRPHKVSRVRVGLISDENRATPPQEEDK